MAKRRSPELPAQALLAEALSEQWSALAPADEMEAWGSRVFIEAFLLLVVPLVAPFDFLIEDEWSPIQTKTSCICLNEGDNDIQA